MHVTLNEPMFEAKLRAARAYEGLDGEVEQAIRSFGEDYFRRECLRPVSQRPVARKDKPRYERVGESCVAAGTYDRVLRYSHHVHPVLSALEAHGARRAKERGPAAVADHAPV